MASAYNKTARKILLAYLFGFLLNPSIKTDFLDPAEIVEFHGGYLAAWSAIGANRTHGKSPHSEHDTADVFIRGAWARLEGATVFNLGGSIVSMPEIVAAIETVVPEIKGRITFEPKQLPFPPTVDDRPLDEALGQMHWIPFVDGVRRTIEIFRMAIKVGKLDVEKALE